MILSVLIMAGSLSKAGSLHPPGVVLDLISIAAAVLMVVVIMLSMLRPAQEAVRQTLDSPSSDMSAPIVTVSLQRC